ncbi:hypothetical protein N2152v2_007974 [Parachlorella kessleri]
MVNGPGGLPAPASEEPLLAPGLEAMLPATLLAPAPEGEAGVDPVGYLMRTYFLSPQQAAVVAALWAGEGAEEVGPDLGDALDAAVTGPAPPHLPPNYSLVDSLLLTAVQEGDFGAVQALASNASADVNAISPNGTWPLQLALEAGNYDLAELLLGLGADANQVGPATGGDTLLLRAVEAHDNETASLLLDHGADTNKPNPSGVTPLLTAVNNADDANVAYLLNKGADPGQASRDGTTPLLAAVSTGQNATIQLLLNSMVNANAAGPGGVTPLLLAVQQDDPTLVTQLLSHGADPNQASANGTTPLLEALAPASGSPADLDIVRELLSRGADVNKPSAAGQSPLKVALDAGDPEAVVVLTAAGAALEGLSPQEREELRSITGQVAPIPPGEEALPVPAAELAMSGAEGGGLALPVSLPGMGAVAMPVGEGPAMEGEMLLGMAPVEEGAAGMAPVME